MALIQASVKCNKISVLVRQLSASFNALHVSTNRLSSSAKETEDESLVTKSVFISQSNNVFTNLALEDWMYRNFDFTKHHVMLLWRNDPCVVIGRHQNPWLEANLDALKNRGITLARRNSGGGTVYHDKGNLNITFFTPKTHYNRKHNLQLLAKTLNREWMLTPEINKKEDIVLDSNYKISGTASKLGRPSAYHHCTLLVDVNKEYLSEALHRNTEIEIITNATQSVPSPTINLRDVKPEVNMDRLMTVLGWEFMRTRAVSQEDGGWDLVSKQNGFQLVNPTDEWFPGLAQIQEEFESWDWVYGKSPSFEVRRRVIVDETSLTLGVNVEKGRVSEVHLRLPAGASWGDTACPPDSKVKLVTSLLSEKYTEDLLGILERAVRVQAACLFQPPHQQQSATASAI